MEVVLGLSKTSVGRKEIIYSIYAEHTLARLIFFRNILFRTSWNWLVSGTSAKNSDNTFASDPAPTWIRYNREDIRSTVELTNRLGMSVSPEITLASV